MDAAPEGAAANELADPVPEDVKEARKERFMAVQAEISAARLAAQETRDAINLYR